MTQGIEVVGVYVRDQDEAVAFYVDALGFKIHTDVRNGPYRWLTVQHPDQPAFQLGLFVPGPPCMTPPPRRPWRHWWPRAPCRPWCWPWTTAVRPTSG